MRIALTSDLHLGITEPRAIEKMVQRLAKSHAEKPYDLILLLGDFSGGGHKSLPRHGGGAHYVDSCLKLFRQHLPEVRAAGCHGNHDLWVLPRSEDAFLDNLDKITQAFSAHSVHYFDHSGPLTIGSTVFMGHSLWYGEIHPVTNDPNFLPDSVYGCPINNWLTAELTTNVDNQLPLDKDKSTYFCSHFPIVNLLTDRDLGFGGSPQLGQILIYHGVKGFFNGHSHSKADGHIVGGSNARQWVCGSDYFKPDFLTVEL